MSEYTTELLGDETVEDLKHDLATLRAQIADLELQHSRDKAIIEALNERVRELEAENELLHKENSRACDFGRQAIIEGEKLQNLCYLRGVEIAQLKRPPMTRDLPTSEGWYWMKHELTICKPFPAEVFNRNGVMCLQEDGRYYKPVNEYAIAIWSARPIEMDPMPEGGE